MIVSKVFLAVQLACMLIAKDHEKQFMIFDSLRNGVGVGMCRDKFLSKKPDEQVLFSFLGCPCGLSQIYQAFQPGVSLEPPFLNP